MMAHPKIRVGMESMDELETRRAQRRSRREFAKVAGLGVIAWGLPVLVLVLGAGGIAFAIRRGSRTPRLSATADDVALVDRERAHHPDDGPNDLGGEAS